MSKPQSLRELVDLAMVKHQTSARQLGFKAQDAGSKMVGTTLSQIRNGTYKSVPSDETIRALAWLAGVSDGEAFMAAGQPVPGPPFAEELPPDVDNLPAKARKAAIDMLRVLVDMNKEAADNATHMNQAGDTPADPLPSDRSLAGTGGMVPHIGLTASRMMVVAQQKYGPELPRVKEMLANPDINGVLHGELRKFTRNILAEQFQQRVTEEFTRMATSVPKVSYVDPNAHPDADSAGNVPLPANYYELAADTSRNYGVEEGARVSARGEEAQELEGDQ